MYTEISCYAPNLKLYSEIIALCLVGFTISLQIPPENRTSVAITSHWYRNLAGGNCHSLGASPARDLPREAYDDCHFIE